MGHPALVVEGHALLLQPSSLQRTDAGWKLVSGEPTLSVHDSPPGEVGVRFQTVQDPPDSPGRPGLPRNGRHGAVAGDLSLWNSGDDAEDSFLEE